MRRHTFKFAQKHAVSVGVSGTRHPAVRRLLFGPSIFEGPPEKGYLDTALSQAATGIVSQLKEKKKKEKCKPFLKCSVIAVVFCQHRVRFTQFQGAASVCCFFGSKVCRQP